MIDVICPVYFLNDDFRVNIKSWIMELPIRKMFIGINNPDLTIENDYSHIEIIDQTYLKTLGACLADLMKRVETEWFVFVHADVEITPYAFKQMEPLMKSDVGIIESSHLHIIDGKPKYYDYYHEKRSYSGFQLIRKEAIGSILDKIEDDYIYRNEDLIFQNICESNGFRHVKSYALHLHQVTTNTNTFSKKETHDMQWRGLVKYSRVKSDLMEQLIIGAIKYVYQFGITRKEVIEFIKKENPMWEYIIEKV